MQLTAEQLLLLQKIKAYVKENYYAPRERDRDVRYSLADNFDEEKTDIRYVVEKNAQGQLCLRKVLNVTFSEKIQQLMNEKGLTSPEVYKYANLDKTLFSKILSDREYSPSKDTAVAAAFGLRLNMKEADDLLDRAGYTLSHSIARDVALECCFKEGITNVVDINILLSELGYKPLGRQ